MRELCGKEIENLATNPMQAFGRDWMALAAGGKDRGFNAMTIAWGHFGTLWERTTHANHLPTAVVYVRPGRYTKQFMDAEPYFTLSAFGPEQKKALAYLGSHSGATTTSRMVYSIREVRLFLILICISSPKDLSQHFPQFTLRCLRKQRPEVFQHPLKGFLRPESFKKPQRTTLHHGRQTIQIPRDNLHSTPLLNTVRPSSARI